MGEQKAYDLKGERDISLLNEPQFFQLSNGNNQDGIMPKQVFCKGEREMQTSVAAVST